MADVKPLRIDTAGQIAQMQTGETVPVLNGGTGATTAAGARTNLGLTINTDVQGYTLDAFNLSALNTTVGIPARTATNTWAMRNIAVTSTARLTITNPAGVAGDPTLDLATLTDSGTGTFLKLVRDAYGRVSGTTAVVAADITGLVDATYVNVNGDTMTSFLTLHADPSSALHAATKQYVDGIAAGQRVQDAVRVATTAAGTLATSFENLDVIDGVTLATGNRILIKDQAAGAENGVYTVNASGAPTRATDFDSASGEVMGGATFWVNEGTVNADTGWTLTTNDAIVVNTTALVFTQSSGLGQVTAGAGLTKTGNQLDIGTAAVTRIVVNADNLDLGQPVIGGSGAAASITKVTVDVYGRVTNTGAATAADVGAQASDATLTALAAYNTNGILVQTAADTFVGRTIVAGGAATIAVTNGSGVAGNPTLELTSGIVTPGTYQSLTVDTYGRVTAGSTSSSTTLTDNFTNANAGTIVIGRAVYATTTTDRVDLAIANSATAAQVIGLVAATSIANLASGSIAFAGVMAATTGQWDVVTGQTGGLTAGAMYFLDNVTAGKFTTTAPTTGYVSTIGRALSTTKIALRFDPTVQL